jgi:threonine/homoserine/homoserine lactone efflux protein
MWHILHYRRIALDSTDKIRAMSHGLLGFVVGAAVLTMIPGADFAVVVRTVLTSGRRAAIGCAVGVASGCLVWGFATAFGITALLQASHIAYTLLRLAGAAYLIWLGIAALRDVRRPQAEPGRSPAGGSTPTSFRQGFVTNLLNPKIGVFYLTVLPAFIPTDGNVFGTTLLYVGIHDAMGLLWLGGIATLVHSARTVFSRSRVRKAMQATTATVLIGFGVRVAAEAR